MKSPAYGFQYQTPGALTAHPVRCWPAICLLILSLSACAQTPTIRIQYVNVPTYIPSPATLTAPVKVDLNPGITYGEALGSLREGLTSCNSQLGAIGVLTPPGPPKKP